MDLVTVSGIVIAAVGTVLVGMATMLKSMIVGKFDEFQRAQDSVRAEIKEAREEAREDNQAVVNRITTLETEHRLLACRPPRQDAA